MILFTFFLLELFTKRNTITKFNSFLLQGNFAFAQTQSQLSDNDEPIPTSPKPKAGDSGLLVVLLIPVCFIFSFCHYQANIFAGKKRKLEEPRRPVLTAALSKVNSTTTETPALLPRNWHLQI